MSKFLEINLPRALDEVLQVSGADVESNTIVLAIDPSAPKPVRPESSFPVARPSAPSPHVQPAETESEPETAEVQPMPEDHEPEPLTEAVETPSESRPMPDDTREDETETAMQYEPEPPTTEMPHIPDTPPQVDQSHFTTLLPSRHPSSGRISHLSQSSRPSSGRASHRADQPSSGPHPRHSRHSSGRISRRDSSRRRSPSRGPRNRTAPAVARTGTAAAAERAVIRAQLPSSGREQYVTERGARREGGWKNL